MDRAFQQTLRHSPIHWPYHIPCGFCPRAVPHRRNLPMQPATSLDEVIAQMRAILTRCIATCDVLGYFPALYTRVTLAVRDAIARGDFQDGPRMERLDVVFANRFLSAYDDYRNGLGTALVWRQAFDTANVSRHNILQQLLI